MVANNKDVKYSVQFNVKLEPYHLRLVDHFAHKYHLNRSEAMRRIIDLAINADEFLGLGEEPQNPP